jgi:hypothetical protein
VEIIKKEEINLLKVHQCKNKLTIPVNHYKPPATLANNALTD